ncbi:hypothetical protein C0J52_02738 [Blattella germanica]|nr:hypothetical protein C0J52_02738 [Blattella germanica]
MWQLLVRIQNQTYSVCKVVQHKCPLNKFKEGYFDWMGYHIDFVEHKEERHREVGIQSQPTFASVTMGNEKCVVKL